MPETIIPVYRRLYVYLANTGWIMSSRVATMVVKFFLTVVVARYLGPESFGALSYALALAALFAVLSHMGAGGLVVRELVKAPDDAPRILGAAFILKSVGAALAYGALLAYALFVEGRDSHLFFLVLVAGLGILLGPLRVADFWFESRVKARFITIASLAGLLLASCVKLALVVAQRDVLWIAAADVLQAAIAAALLVFFLSRRSGLSLRTLQYRLAPAAQLFRAGWPVYLGSIFALVYLKIDQVMLRWLADASELGQYAVAANLSEAWYFLPAAIVSSVFPALIRIKDADPAAYSQRLQQLFDVLFCLALAAATVTTVFALPLVGFLFGEQYAGSASILVIHVWAGLFVFMRSAFSRWILIENVLIFSLVTQGAGAIINVLLNIPLITMWGGTGAATATLVSYAVASFLALAFSARTRPVFWMMSRAMAAPLRYPLGLVARPANRP